MIRHKWSEVKRTLCFSYYVLLLASCFLLITCLGGCASFSKQEKILAVVDGEPINEKDLNYSLRIAHRRRDLSTAGSLDISQFVQKIINVRLIADEARRMGIEQFPEVQRAVRAFVLRESVVRLHQEEIVQKVSITEEDIMEIYRKNYMRFNIIEADSEEAAKNILDKLKDGADFSDMAREYSSNASIRDGGAVLFRRNALDPYILKSLDSLKPDELSDIIKIKEKYYILKALDIKGLPDEKFETVRMEIEKSLRKKREKERSDEYLGYLREQAVININQELLSEIKLDVEQAELDKLWMDKSPLAEVYDSVLTVGDFVEIALPVYLRSKDKSNINEAVINSWIDHKLVDHEAISRHYEMTTDLRDRVRRYQNQFLENVFIKRVIEPLIVVTDEALENYYLNNQKNYLNPALFKVQQITVETMEEARNILNQLENGADFSWLAKIKSPDSEEDVEGGYIWLTRKELPKPVREIIDSLKPGDISPIFSTDSRYSIIKLSAKTEESIKEFDKVKDNVTMAYFREQLVKLYNKYLEKLRQEAEIRVFDDAIQSIEKKMGNDN